MKATATFYNDGTDCCLNVPNDNGGIKHVIFGSTSDLVNYAHDNNYEVAISGIQTL